MICLLLLIPASEKGTWENFVSTVPPLGHRVDGYRSGQVMPGFSPGLITVVIVIVPITITVPAMFVFVPPPMVFGPAPLPQFMQFTPFMICLPAVPSMTLNGPMKIVFLVRDAPLAPVTIVCVKMRYSGENKSNCQSKNWQERLAGSDFIHGTPVFYPNRLKLIFGLGGHPLCCHATGVWAVQN